MNLKAANIAVLSLFYCLIAAPVFGASGMPALNIRAIVWDVVILIGIAVIFGLLNLLVNAAPFIDAVWKTYIKYALLIIAVLFIIYIILGWIGM